MCGGARGREGESERCFRRDASVSHDDCSQNTVSLVKAVCAAKKAENDKKLTYVVQYK